MNSSGPRLELTDRLELMPVLWLFKDVNVTFRAGINLVALEFFYDDAVVKFRFDRDRGCGICVSEMVDEMIGLAVFPLFRMNRQRFFA